MEKKRRIAVTNVPNMRTFADMVEYLKGKFRVETDAMVADLLKFKSKAEITIRKNNNKIPLERMLILCGEKNISPDELLFGRPPDYSIFGQFEREDIAKRLVWALAKLEKENPDYYRKLYREVIGEVDWINTQKKSEMSERLVADKSVLLKHNREKMINVILFFASNTEKCETMKLMKLMYFLDFLHFRGTGRSVTGLNYFAWKQGPVPVDLYAELSNTPRPDLMEAIKVEKTGEIQKIVPQKKFDDSIFSKREIRLMEELSDHFKKAEAKEITEKYHLPKEPWFKTFTTKGEGKLIRYMIAIDGKHGLTMREIIERQEEIREMYKSFGISWETAPSDSGDLFNPPVD